MHEGMVASRLFHALCTAICALAFAPLGCDGRVEGDGDADGDADGDGDGDADGADMDGDRPDGSGPPDPGPLVLVSRSMAVLPEATCDVDGDGDLDSALESLGEHAEVLAAGIQSYINASAEPGSRLLVHFSDVEDRAMPQTSGSRGTAYRGWDIDEPFDPTDDFSGEEPFYVSSRSLDACGEPLRWIEGINIDSGALSGGAGEMAMAMGSGTIVMQIVSVEGSIEPHGRAFVIRPCGYVTVDAFGAASYPVPGIGEMTMLEVLLYGGAAFGVDAIPGIQPDVDFDGDGLERLELDADGRLFRCIDGDHTIIEGRDCWRDPRIADAYAMTFELSGVSARFGGRDPGWALGHDGGCEEWPLPESFFDTTTTEGACVGLDEPCDPTVFEPCCDGTHRCSGESRRDYRCAEACLPAECDYFRHPFVPEPGACDVVGTLPVCRPYALRAALSECTPGTVGCPRETSEDTACVEIDGRTSCLDACDPPADLCPSDHWCVPLHIEPGGACVLR